ncbi:glutamate-5-semialdehyde dehydrogenase [Nitratiruptor sp. SB155-2]|uniref:Gamma-glutamyl phosphate reductase n=1 Tax=Nitratiruptor sp. (strain SB155-2) TaxID=387092 RepID=PROA_NITSB|nr:glutamate-5-semialdehyde dehydrogenase [Nitratiruptor sp. SB155-2]A6Q3B4.1 RecName: Full=Gamma-glutamyl phosphate reductase; Short=GPR; AltName: Full=Glutamate-5-semialdehyde dehydrogenase; AltName: Full=Glutamyl-gamma-semialdehyde dehydrogenase; Short=GSA dehydrogenase [Nitratiruptor sp. SB155-2]BAF69973.1 glutamate-5-semialdehyde dehydrogenase [Nitratiruptor sp. SB155-2]
MEHFLKKAKASASELLRIDGAKKKSVLLQIADDIEKNSNKILAANEKDMALAREMNLSSALIDRLFLDEKRVRSMAESVREIAMLKDPVGRVLDGWVLDNGLRIEKVSIPIGVIGIIYESRPNVTSDAAALCFKSGNVSILKGGKEAKNSNEAIAETIQAVLEKNDLPKELVSLLPDYSREGVEKLIKMDKYVDLIIPRGGEGLIRYVSENATVPVVKHDKGLCHTYIDKDADFDKAVAIAVNAKVQRPGVCNAMETLLVDYAIKDEILLKLYEAFKPHMTTLKGCALTKEVLPDIETASEEDFHTEYLENILSIKVVDGVEEAIEHIRKYGSGHSEAIVTENYTTAEKFMNEVDAACVYVNASTRFTDGGVFGFGAEVGISTNKLHARGPMGINDLTTYKYKIYGEGQIRQ